MPPLPSSILAVTKRVDSTEESGEKKAMQLSSAAVEAVLVAMMRWRQSAMAAYAHRMEQRSRILAQYAQLLTSMHESSRLIAAVLHEERRRGGCTD